MKLIEIFNILKSMFLVISKIMLSLKSCAKLNLSRSIHPLFLLLILIGSAWSIEDIGPRRNLFIVKEIEIRGIKKVEKEAVLEKIHSRKEMILDNYTLKKDIAKIYAMKHFEWVEAHLEGDNRLVFVVKEKPIITELKIEGNSEVDDDDLLGEIKSKKFSILDINTVKNDVGLMQKFYEEKGYYLANIRYEIKEVTKENVRVTFFVKEYDKVKVKKIIFLGNIAFSDKQLKDIMETREENLFSFMSGAGSFKEFNFQTDLERIKYFYRTKGYLQINIGGPEITVSEDKKWVFITIKVNEGPMFTVNEITFQGEILFPEEEMKKKIIMAPNRIYSEQELQKDIQMLTEMYQDEGYAFANVLRHLQVVPGENKVNIEFSFEKGKIAHFGTIKVVGNTKTRDKVIRRELLIREGMKFSGSALRRSKENVNRLGFFEPKSVVFKTKTRKGRDDVLDIEVSVKERNTGQISLGAGYSTATGGFMQASISQNNFRGLGQSLSFSFSWAKTSQTFNIGFTEPYLFDTKWTAGGDIFKTSNSTSSSYSYKRQGFDVRVGYPIFDYTRMFFTYKLEDTKIKSHYDPTIDTNTENGIASSVKVTVVRDKRNNKFEPSKGYYLSLGNEYAGVGGDKKWFKTDFDARYFYSIWKDLVFRSRLYTAKLNVVDNRPIPRTEKFSLGGARNLRGFTYEAIGPKTDPDKHNRKFNLGGLFTIFSSLELEHPLAREAGLKWVVFFDVGNVYRNYIGENSNYDLRFDYGFGFRWFSPIGVLRFEFGWPLGGRDTEGGSQFHFDIGQLF